MPATTTTVGNRPWLPATAQPKPPEPSAEEKRRAALDELKALAKRRKTELPPLQQTIDKRQGEYQKAAAALQAAGQRLAEAQANKQNLESGLDARETRLRNQLRSSIPVIDEFITAARAEVDQLRKSGSLMRTSGGRSLDGRALLTTHSNYESLGDRVKALMELSRAAPDLAIEDRTPEEIEAELVRRYENLPDVVTAVTGP